MTDMNGPTNYSRIMYYWWMTYYLFPREVGTSLDHVTRITKDSLLGRTSKSDQEILTNGYDAIVDFPPHETLTLRLQIGNESGSRHPHHQGQFTRQDI